MRDFNVATIRRLAHRGVVIIGLQAIPGSGDMPFANADRGYLVSDNGLGRVLTFTQVTELANT